jgi:hypothetical protein
MTESDYVLVSRLAVLRIARTAVGEAIPNAPHLHTEWLKDALLSIEACIREDEKNLKVR